MPPRPKRSKGTFSVSLASRVKEQIHLEQDVTLGSRGCRIGKRPKKPSDPLNKLARGVSRKIEAGDFRGAIRLVSRL